MRFAEEQQESAAARAQQLAAQRPGAPTALVQLVDGRVGNARLQPFLHFPGLMQQMAEGAHLVATGEHVAHGARDAAETALGLQKRAGWP